MSVNGSVQKHLLESVWSGLLSRVVTVLLIPLIGFVAYQAWGSIKDNTNAVVELRVTLEKVNANQDAIAGWLDLHEKRLDRVERHIWP